MNTINDIWTDLFQLQTGTRTPKQILSFFVPTMNILSSFKYCSTYHDNDIMQRDFANQLICGEYANKVKPKSKFGQGLFESPPNRSYL